MNTRHIITLVVIAMIFLGNGVTTGSSFQNTQEQVPTTPLQAIPISAHNATELVQTDILGRGWLTGLVNTFVWSPDGRYLTVGTSPGVWLYTLDGLEAKPRLLDHRFVAAVAFSSDSTLLASGGTDRKIRLWSTTDGTAQGVLEGLEALVVTLAFSPDHKLLASSDREGKVQVWEIETGRVIAVFNSDFVSKLAFHPNGTQMILRADDLLLWDFGAETEPTPLIEEDRWVAISSNGRRFTTRGTDGVLRVWDVESRTSVGSLTLEDQPLTDIAIDPEGVHVAYSYGDGTFYVWDSSRNTQRVVVWLGHDPNSRSGFHLLALHPNGDRLAIAFGDGFGDRDTVAVLDVDTGMAVKTLADFNNGVFSLAVSSEGSLLASGHGDMIRALRGQAIQVWDVTTGQRIERSSGFEGVVLALDFSPDDTLLASGHGYSPYRSSLSTMDDITPSIQLRDTDTWAVVRTITSSSVARSNSPRCVAFSSDGTLLASCSTEDFRLVELWRVNPWGKIADLWGTGFITGVVFSPDQSFLAAVSERISNEDFEFGENAVWLWDTTSYTQYSLAPEDIRRDDEYRN